MRKSIKTIATSGLLIGCLSLQVLATPLFYVTYTEATEKKELTAGVSSILGAQLFSGRINNNDENNETLLGKNEEALSLSSISSIDETGARTICGYYNIGISKAEPNLNIRKEPGMSSEIVGKLPKNSACEILGEENGWVKISSGNASGWVSKEYLLTGDEAIAMAETLAKEVATVTTDVLFVREEPNTDCAKISSVAMGEQLTIIDKADGWYKIALDNEEGWISADYAKASYELSSGVTISELRFGTGISETRVNLVNFALQYVGGRYVWGGESLTYGVDCSGFTMKVYQQFGVYLPHYSVSQSYCGRRISARDAKPGDLFFYSNGYRINHVAIYIGNGQVVHASNERDGIKISNAYYRTPTCVVSLLND